MADIFRQAKQLLNKKDSGAQLTEEEYQLRLRILELVSILEGQLKFQEWQRQRQKVGDLLKGEASH